MKTPMFRDDMRRVFRGLVGVAAVIIAVIVLLKLTPVPVAAQAKAGAAGPAPKTSWGEPDLQGIWHDEVEIPLERPAKYANKEFFTDAEVAELDQVRTRLAFGAQRAEKGSAKDVGGAYDPGVYLAHKRTGRRTSLIVDPPDGKVPPFVPEVIKKRAEIREWQVNLLQATEACRDKLPGCDGGTYTPGVPSPRRTEAFKYYPSYAINRMDNPEDHGLSYRCVGAVLPDFDFQAVISNKHYRIVQSPGAVSIFYDTGQGQGWHRSIPVDGSPHLPPSIRLWWGDSRGRWEGNTLVVDVTNFSPRTDFRGSGENLHLVERWTRTGPNSIEYVVTMDDATTWTKPWTVKQDFGKQSDEANRVYKEPRCHEGNFGLTGALSGARVVDTAFAEGRGPDPGTICLTGCGGFNDPGEEPPLR